MTKAAYIIDDLTGKNKLAMKVHGLVRLRPFQERFGPFPFFPARKQDTKAPKKRHWELSFSASRTPPGLVASPHCCFTGIAVELPLECAPGSGVPQTRVKLEGDPTIASLGIYPLGTCTELLP